MTRYCTGPDVRGLTCKPEGLVLVRRLSEDVGDAYVRRERVYRCSTCGGYYKHVYAERLETRNFDAEGGWQVYDDVYLKVGDAPSPTARFTPAEARLYGDREDSNAG